MNIDGEMTIYRAAELRPLLQAALAALPAGAELALDLGGVSEFDSAGVQLLMAAKNSAAANGGTLRLAATSPAVLEVFETLDLAAYFDLSPAQAPA